MRPRVLSPATLILTMLLLVASAIAAPPAPAKGTAMATFAGGCFWCMEPPFEALPGVISVTSGFSGGMERNPTYGGIL